jgi:hypothetical protein
MKAILIQPPDNGNRIFQCPWMSYHSHTPCIRYQLYSFLCKRLTSPETIYIYIYIYIINSKLTICIQSNKKRFNHMLRILRRISRSTIKGKKLNSLVWRQTNIRKYQNVQILNVFFFFFNVCCYCLFIIFLHLHLLPSAICNVMFARTHFCNILFWRVAKCFFFWSTKVEVLSFINHLYDNLASTQG